ncbi:collagen alpha-1(I) chain-like [Nyctibius grandis]|uniref:collagen alpha-1(I) chain-like n=1 Tax=Nyctibius grandis TaxID=48427 RepID=UPI0035BC0328
MPLRIALPAAGLSRMKGPTSSLLTGKAAVPTSWATLPAKSKKYKLRGYRYRRAGKALSKVFVFHFSLLRTGQSSRAGGSGARSIPAPRRERTPATGSPLGPEAAGPPCPGRGLRAGVPPPAGPLGSGRSPPLRLGLLPGRHRPGTGLPREGRLERGKGPTRTPRDGGGRSGEPGAAPVEAPGRSLPAAGAEVPAPPSALARCPCPGRPTHLPIRGRTSRRFGVASSLPVPPTHRPVHACAGEAALRSGSLRERVPQAGAALGTGSIPPGLSAPARGPGAPAVSRRGEATDAGTAPAAPAQRAPRERRSGGAPPAPPGAPGGLRNPGAASGDPRERAGARAPGARPGSTALHLAPAAAGTHVRATPLPAGGPACPGRPVGSPSSPEPRGRDGSGVGSESASVWSELGPEPGAPIPVSVTAAPGTQPPARGRWAGRDGRFAAALGPGRATRLRAGGRGWEPRPLLARESDGAVLVTRAVPERGAGGGAWRRAGGARAEPGDQAVADGASGARRQRTPLRGRGPCASCSGAGRATGPRREEASAEPRLSPRERPGGGAAPLRGSAAPTGLDAEAGPAAPSGGRGVRARQSPRPHGEALRRRSGTRSPSLSAALPSKIHLGKMKVHANEWRLLACAFNHEAGSAAGSPRGSTRYLRPRSRPPRAARPRGRCSTRLTPAPLLLPAPLPAGPRRARESPGVPPRAGRGQAAPEAPPHRAAEPGRAGPRRAGPGRNKGAQRVQTRRFLHPHVVCKRTRRTPNRSLSAFGRGTDSARYSAARPEPRGTSGKRDLGSGTRSGAAVDRSRAAAAGGSRSSRAGAGPPDAPPGPRLPLGADPAAGLSRGEPRRDGAEPPAPRPASPPAPLPRGTVPPPPAAARRGRALLPTPGRAGARSRRRTGRGAGSGAAGAPLRRDPRRLRSHSPPRPRAPARGGAPQARADPRPLRRSAAPAAPGCVEPACPAPRAPPRFGGRGGPAGPGHYLTSRRRITAAQRYGAHQWSSNVSKFEEG